MATAATTTKPAEEAKKDSQPRSHVREAVETVVFVVTLVLLLKLFVVEAFVIPTGSMAETLYGYQKIVNCPQCGFTFPVNSHDEVEGDPQTKRKLPLKGFVCPNCMYKGDFSGMERPANRSGDRVLVLKPIYEIAKPHRGDVVVFKYPKQPEEIYTATNYIKRAMGFGGESVAIHRGELFTTKAIKHPDPKDANGDPVDPKDLWESEYMYRNAPEAVELFEKNRAAGFPTGEENFQVVRKTDDQVLACKRIVWDNDHQPQALKGVAPPRWSTEGPGWTVVDDKDFTHAGGEQGWLRYRHLVDKLWSDPKNAGPSVIKNFLGYNAGILMGVNDHEEQPRASSADDAWVGDLILEGEFEFGGSDSEVILELSRGAHRYRAEFAGGNVTLSQTGKDAKTLSTRPSGIKGKGTYKLRFANVDFRLRVWVDGKAIDFGSEADYPPAEAAVENGSTEGWTVENDLNAPASIGVKGSVVVKHLTLWRDIYYVHSHEPFAGTRSAEIFYVQPGHYMCMGDNSAQSSDSRMWGTVPERLMLGKAVFVFFPFWPFVPPPSRIGLIK